MQTSGGPAPLTWCEDAISNDGFRARFGEVSDILRDWWKSYRSVSGADILDFGCGEGITALSLSLKHGARRVVGVDIMPDPERCLSVAREQLGLMELPSNLTLHRVTPGSIHDSTDRFDFVYSWSVFEHVDERYLADTIRLIRSLLRPNGLLFIQVAPLFFSAEGSHLFEKIREPWAHLLHQHSALYEKLAAAVPERAELDGLWSTFRTLNRLTANELVAFVRSAGFDILRTHSTKDAHVPPARLTAIFHEEVLTTNQIVILASPV